MGSISDRKDQEQEPGQASFIFYAARATFHISAVWQALDRIFVHQDPGGHVNHNEQRSMENSLDKEYDELLYAQVAEEVSSGAISKGLWLKATVESIGSEFAAKSRYTGLRIDQFIRQQASALEKERKQENKLPLLKSDEKVGNP